MSLHFEAFDSARSMSQAAATRIADSVLHKPNLLLCASAGGSPTLTYQALTKIGERKRSLFQRMHVVLVDEWGGLSKRHPATCREDVASKLVRPLGIKSRQFEGFNSEAENPREDCDRISRWLGRHGPIDIVILGLGLNGHIAMIEPATEFELHAHVAKLAASSLRHPMLTANKAKPTCGMSLGMADILGARQILLLVHGEHKRQVLARLRVPKVTNRFPASFLWLHPNASVLHDRASAGADF